LRKFDAASGPAALCGDSQVRAVPGDVAAKWRGAAALDDAQELAFPVCRGRAGRVHQQSRLRFDVRIARAALRGECALPRRRHPPLGREFDDDESGQVELQTAETRASEDDGINTRAFAELAHPRRNVAAQWNRDGLRRKSADQRAATQGRRADTRAACQRQEPVPARLVKLAAYQQPVGGAGARQDGEIREARGHGRRQILE